MNLNQLYYFCELAEKRQYTKAAKSLFISQPTLSVSIKQLEKELNCKLFKHAGHYVELTKYGRIFYDNVIKSLNALNEGKRKVKQASNQDRGFINIASIPTYVGTLIPPLVKDFKQETQSPVRFVYHDNPSQQVCEGIEYGWYDIGICSYVPDFPQFSYVPFFTEDIIAIVSPESDLASIDNISVEELRGEDLITYTKKIEIGRNVTDALLSRDPDLKITNRMHDELAIAGQVLTNNMVGIVADTIYLDGFNIHKIKLDLPKDTRQVYLVYDPNHYFSPELLEFIDFLKSKKGDIHPDGFSFRA